MQYPHLFEAEPKLNIGRDKEVVMKDPFINDILKVGGKKKNEKISIQELKDLEKASKSNYKNSLTDFLKSKGYDTEKELSSDDPKEPNATWGEFWNYETKQHEEKTKQYREQEAASKNGQPIVPQIVLDFYAENNKAEDLQAFLASTPGGESIDRISYLFEYTEQILTNEDNKSLRFRISGVVDVTLNKQEQEKWLDDAIKYLKIFADVEDVNSIYTSEILKQNSLLGVMFMLKAAGLGRGEVVMSYIIKDTAVSGGGESFELKVGGIKYEIKEYVVSGDCNQNIEKCATKSELGAIRLGTGGKVTRFEFWENIQESIRVAKKIARKHKKDLEEIVGDYFYKVWMKVIDDENQDGIATGVNGGELPKGKMMTLKMFYVLAHAFSEEKSDGDAEQYTTAILKGPNAKPETVLIEPITVDELNPGKTLEVKSSEDLTEMMTDLRAIPYIRDPENLTKDLDNAPVQYFEHEGLDAFIVFRRSGVFIAHAEDFKVSTISQAAMTLIEKKLAEDKEDKDLAKRSYEAWKKSIEDAKKDNPEAYKEILKMTKVEDFIMGELEKDVIVATKKKAEQKDRERDRERERRKNMTEEEKELERQKDRDRRAKMTPEEKEKQRKREKERRDAKKKTSKNESFYPSLFNNINERNILIGGKGDNTNPKDVNQRELKLGRKVEAEHSKNPKIRKEIALDHLTEDPEYYTKLDDAGLVDENLNTKKIFRRPLNDKYVVK